VPALFVAAVLWGLGFLAQKESTLVGLSPLWAMTVRFVVATPVALLAAGSALWRPAAPVPRRGVCALGALLFLCCALQYVGIVQTPVARVSLITGLYVAFTPLLAPVFGHPRAQPLHWLGALLSLVGLAGITGALGTARVPLNFGDGVVLVQAVLVAVHLLVVARVARRVPPFVLNALQTAIVALISVPLALAVDGVPTLPTSPRAWLSIGYLAGPSTVLAFGLQIAGQKHTAPATAATLMLLEAPIGALAATWWFHEEMTAWQAVAAVVLLAGVGLSLTAELRRRRRADD